MSAPAPSMFSPAARQTAERLGLKMGRANLVVFAETLLALAQQDRQILVVTSDSRGSAKLVSFAQALPRAGQDCRVIVTVEEHAVHGGLGEACAAVLMQAGVHVPLRIVGIPDEDTVTGSQADIFRHYGMTMEGLADTARQLLQQAEVVRK